MPRRSPRFDPDRIAYFEAAGWRAYYDRAWLKLLKLIVQLSQEQFRIPFPLSLLAAYYIVRASVAWVPLDHDEAVVRDYYARFYRLARRFSGLRFDPERVAALELRERSRGNEVEGVDLAMRVLDRRPDLGAAVFEHEHVVDVLARAERRGPLRPQVDDLPCAGSAERPEGCIVLRRVQDHFAAAVRHRRPPVGEPAHFV
jgi:hypothetical protein